MKKFFLTALLPFLLFSCDTKRPDVENLEYTLTVNSVQNGATVEILDGETVVASGTTDESGTFTFSGLNEMKALTVKVCKGTVNLVSSTDPVAWTGCNQADFIPEDKQEIVLTVDFLSTFISKYDSETSAEEWMEYLDLTTLASPALQTSLTDSTKRYLWYQGLAKIAENVSKANGVTPETMYSTENLLNLLMADLADDSIINGSTEAKFGTLNVEAVILKSVLADAIPEVSKSFTKSDLKTWTDKIRYSDAKFLGGSGGDIDSEKPVIEIETPEDGGIIFGTVEVKATATDNVKITSLSCTITGDGMPELADTDEDDDKFSAVFDSKLIPDGNIKVKCIASDGTSLSEKEITVTVSNSNQVTLSAFITNPLTLWDSVTVYDSADNKVLATTFDEEEVTVISLSPGTFRIVFKGGTYSPVFLNDETIEFDSALETRVTVKAGEKTSTVATPLTTLREHLFRALKEKGDTEAETKSFDLISEHIDKDFPLYIEPVSKNQLTENSKYYIVLASLERLAVLIGERHDPPLEKGSITIEQVLKALTDDLGTEDKAVLDGTGKINKFAVDSYLFRYWYAIAVKLFLESEENLTGLKFSDLQTVISNISMDESELFPENEEPKKVTDKPPVISEKQFKRSFETGFQNYSVSNIIYANDSVFSVKFKALPDESGDLTIDTVEVSGDIEVESLSDINEEGIYTAVVKFPTTDDGDKTVLITAVDNAENVGTATLQAVKDTVKPVIETFELKQGEKVITGEYTTVPFTMNYIVEEENFRDAQLGVKEAADSNPFIYTVFSTVKYGEKQVSKTDLSGDQQDGEYIFSVKFTDQAGNEETTQFQKVIDTVKPEIQSIVMTPQINGHGFINSRAITVEITATDNLEHTLNYWIRRNVSNYDLNGNNPPNLFNIEEPADASITYRFKVSDKAGNETAESEPFAFTIDTVEPVITISNKAALEAKPWRSDADELVLNYTIDELNRDLCELRINGAKADDLFGFPTGTKSFKSHELLDPTIGPGAPNIVSIYCIDKAGNEKEIFVNVYIDDEAPFTYIGTSAFTYGGSVVDPRWAPWLSIKPWVHASDNFGKKDNVTVRFYYTTALRNALGHDETKRYPSSGFSTITAWQDTVPATGAHCTISDLNCRVQIPHPSDTYLVSDSYKNMLDRTSNFILFVEVEDLAGNKTQTSMDWVSDREPVKIEPYGIVYENGKIWVSFVSYTMIPSFRITVNGVTSTPEHIQYYHSGLEIYLYACPFTANPGTTYNVTVSSRDSYGNYTTSNCSAFSANSGNFCFSGPLKVDDPQLSIERTEQTATTLKYEITSDSTITYCKIFKEGTYFKDCAGTLGTGVKTETITTWDDASYTVTVKAVNGTGVTAERSMNFYIDKTPTSFSLNIEGYQNFYDNTSPTLKPTATIAGGVKKLTVYLRYRKVHATRKGSMTQCTGTYCYETHAQKIYEAVPELGFSSGKPAWIFPVYTPPVSSFKSGYYTDVRYVIESNITGESVEGVFDLAAANKTIRIVKTADDKVKILSRTINTSTREMAVQFVPSVISTMPLSATANFTASVTGNKDITSSDMYYRICGNDSSNMKTQYQFYPGMTKFRAKYSRKTYGSSVYTAYFKSNVDSYFFGKLEGNFKHNVNCGQNSDCPVTEENFYLSTKCSSSSSGSCVVNQSPHRSDPSRFYDVVDERLQCGNPSSVSSSSIDYYSYIRSCPFLRDFWYFRKDLKMKITDDFGFSLTVTNSSPETYTDPSTCPQEKIITEQ